MSLWVRTTRCIHWLIKWLVVSTLWDTVFLKCHQRGNQRGENQALLPASATVDSIMTCLGLCSPEQYLDRTQVEGRDWMTAPLVMAKSSIWSIRALFLCYAPQGFFSSERIRSLELLGNAACFSCSCWFRLLGGAEKLIKAIWCNHNKVKNYKNSAVTKPTSSEVWGTYSSEVNGSR